mgnify:CR=1 FL=1
MPKNTTSNNKESAQATITAYQKRIRQLTTKHSKIDDSVYLIQYYQSKIQHQRDLISQAETSP